MRFAFVIMGPLRALTSRPEAGSVYKTVYKTGIVAQAPFSAGFLALAESQTGSSLRIIFFGIFVFFPLVRQV